MNSLALNIAIILMLLTSQVLGADASTAAVIAKSAFDISESAIDVKQLKQMAVRGDGNASLQLGNAYRGGSGLTRNDKEAAYWYRKAAKLDIAEAQYKLGKMYATGEGVRHDLATAASWYRQAAQLGLAAAQFSLGTLYKQGLGVKSDPELAVDWLHMAAGQGFSEAEFAVGALYENGEGIPRDRELALFWYERASAAGYAPATHSLQSLQLRETDSDPASAVSFAPPSGSKSVPAGTAGDSSVSDASGARRTADWFAGLSPDQYTLQLISFSEEASCETFIRLRDVQEEAACFAVQKGKETRYTVTFGLYDSYKAAELAGRFLPTTLKDLDPKVGQTGRIQEAMLR